MIKRLVFLIFIIAIFTNAIYAVVPVDDNLGQLTFESKYIQLVDDVRVDVIAYYNNNYSYTVVHNLKIDPRYPGLEYFPACVGINLQNLDKVVVAFDYSLYSSKGHIHKYLNETSTIGDNVRGYSVWTDWVWNDYDDIGLEVLKG